MVNAPLIAPKLLSVIAPLAVNETLLPVTLLVKLSAPVSFIVTLPTLLTVPKVKLLALVKLISLALPVLARFTVPVRLFALFKVIAPALPVNVTAPALAACEMFVLAI